MFFLLISIILDFFIYFPYVSIFLGTKHDVSMLTWFPYLIVKYLTNSSFYHSIVWTCMCWFVHFIKNK